MTVQSDYNAFVEIISPVYGVLSFKSVIGSNVHGGLQYAHNREELEIISGGGQKIFIAGSGNVGIGTKNPGSYRLYVNGNMYVNGDITTDSATYPDYVFEPEYKLMPLKGLKEFITEKKHLPGMPSAKEVEEKGVKIFAQNRLVLEKLEEVVSLHL